MAQKTEKDQAEKTEGSKNWASKIMSMSANFFSEKPWRAVTFAVVFLSMLAIPGVAQVKQAFDIVDTAKDSVEMVIAAEKMISGDKLKGTVEADGEAFDWSAPVNADVVKPALAQMEGLSDRFAVNAMRPMPTSRFMQPADAKIQPMKFLTPAVKGSTHKA